MTVPINLLVLSLIVGASFMVGYGVCTLRAWLRSKLP